MLKHSTIHGRSAAELQIWVSKPKLTKSILDDVSDPLSWLVAQANITSLTVHFHSVSEDAQKYTSRTRHFRMGKLAKFEGFLSQACD